jgi:hypothetical protein
MTPSEHSPSPGLFLPRLKRNQGVSIDPPALDDPEIGASACNWTLCAERETVAIRYSYTLYERGANSAFR